MRSSAPEGQHAHRAKQAPPSGSSGATAGPAGAPPTSPHTAHSPRPQSSVSLPHKSVPPAPQRGAAGAATATLTPQSRVTAQPRGVSGHPQIHRSAQRSATVSGTQTAQAQPQQRSPPAPSTASGPPGVGSSGTKPLTSLQKGLQPRLSQVHHTKTSPQPLSKSQGSFGNPSQPKSQPNPGGAKTTSSSFKGASPSSKGVPAAPNPPNFGEYDDQEWDVGVGHLIIDLDADIAQADRGRMSGAPPPTGPHAHQGTPVTPATEDKHSLKMKIKRTKPPTKTSEAKHEIVKPDTTPSNTGGVVVMVSGNPQAAGNTSNSAAPQHNGAAPGVKDGPQTCPSRAGPSPSAPRPVSYKKEKRRLDVNGTATSPPPPSGVSVSSRSNLPPHTSSPVAPHSSASAPNPSHPTITPSHASPAPVSSSPVTSGTSSSLAGSSVSGPHHQTPVKTDPLGVPNASPSSARLPQSALQSQPSSHPLLQSQQQQAPSQLLSQQPQPPTQHSQPQSQPAPQQQTNSQSSQPSDSQSSSQPQNDGVGCPAAKRQKLNDEGSKRDVCVGTSVATITEPDCLGPCEPGSSVTLEGIVWHETEGGVLVVNVTWRGKTYVGTLLDCTKHDWAPPRFCDSPTSDLESRTPKGRAKRGRAAAAAATSVASSVAHTTPTTELSVTETRSGKLRNASVKGRRGAATPNFNPPPSPVKVDAGGMKRKGREGDPLPLPDPKMAKRARSSSRGTPTNGCSSPSPPEQPAAVHPQQPQPHPPPAGDIPQPPTSPQLIECPDPNCSKKYKHINGLRYHQSHAHNNSQGGNEEEPASTENNEIEENSRQLSPPSPTPLASTLTESSSQELLKPAVLRPTTSTASVPPVAVSAAPPTRVISETSNGEISVVSSPSIIIQQQPPLTPSNGGPIPSAAGVVVSAPTVNKSPQHLYVYHNSVSQNNVLQKPSGNLSSSPVIVRQSQTPQVPQGNPTCNLNSSQVTPSESFPPPPGPLPNTPTKQENSSTVSTHSSSDASPQQNNTVVLNSTPNQISSSHSLILSQPKASPSHPTQPSSHQLVHATLHQNQSPLSSAQVASNTSQHLQQIHSLQQPLQQQQQHQLQLQHVQQPHQNAQQQQQLHQQQQMHQQQLQIQQSIQHQQLQQSSQQSQPQSQNTSQPSHPLQIQVSVSSQHSVHTPQHHQIHSLQQQKHQVQHVLGQSQQVQHNSTQPIPPQPGTTHLKAQIVHSQPQPSLKSQAQSPAQQNQQHILQQPHPTQTVYHPPIHDQPSHPTHPSQQIIQQSLPRGELKPELLNRINAVHNSSLPPSSRSSSSSGGTLSDASAAPTTTSSTAISTSTLPPTGGIPEGTPLSSLPGSTVTNLKLKPGVEGEKLLGKPKEMVNGLPQPPTKKEEDQLCREDARSPAYSDISDANDSAPVIDENVDSKDFKDEKKSDIPLGGAPPYAYGLYFGGYGQPPHPYLMPPIQHPQSLPSKPGGDLKDLKDKAPEKEKKDYLPLPGGSDYVKFPPQYLYSYSHLYPPGYPDPYLREPLYKEMLEKPKLEHEDCISLEEGDKGPTDLSRNAPNSTPNNLTEKNILNLKEGKPPNEVHLALKDQLDGRGIAVQDKRPVDPTLAYRYMSPYDARMPLVGGPLDKPLDAKVTPGIPKPSTPVPLSSPRMVSTPPGNNPIGKEEKTEKRGELKSEGVKPTMETTGPPPPPTSSAYYAPFPYTHVPFDPYRPPMVPGMPLTAGFPPYLAAPPPGLGGLRYQLGVPNGPEDLSPSGTGATILTPGLYTGSHKIAELQERAQKSPSGQGGSSTTGLVMNRGGSPLTLIANNPLSGAPPHSLAHIVSSPSFSSAPTIFTSSIGAQQAAPLMSSGHFGDRKTPPVGPRIPPHPSLPEGYAYPLLPAQFPPHFTALGVSPTGIATVGVGGPGVAPSGMAGGAPPPK